MIDVYLFVALLTIGAAWIPLAASRRHLPRLVGDPEKVQREYERGYRRRLVLRLLPPTLLVYFIARAAATPYASVPSGFVPAVFATVCGTFVVSSLAATLWRYRWDRAFVARHPQFADGVQPLAVRLMGPTVVLAMFGMLVLSALSQDTVAVFGFLGAAFVVLFGGQRLMLAALVRSRIEVSPDSPFGRIVAETVSRFGFVPKRAILAPSTVANAYALPDGTVMVTTALRAIATDEEIGAILAHELSHVRDRDVPRIRRAGLLVLFLTMLLSGGTAYGLALLPNGRLFIIPIVALTVATFLSSVGVFRSPMLHRLEFKCDRAAADLGLGPDLARGLTKLHDYMGMPHRWIGLERRLVTHPSLDDRLDALR